MNTYKKISLYGPGGRNCTCCGPAPKHRKKHDRMIKRREQQNAKKKIEREVMDVNL